MTKLKVLLTGGGGMVGRNILEHSAIDEFDILAPRSAELDLRNFDAIKTYLDKYRPNFVIHAAGKVGGIQANMREPVGFLLENLDMGRNIVWASRQAGIKKFINLGSSCMYPRGHEEPLKEEMILKGELEPTNEGYALAKVLTAKLCEYVTREDASYQYKTLIPCNLYGRHDKFDPKHSHLLPAIIHKVHQAKKNNEKTVEIWGDGTARREFMYSGDLADAVIESINQFDSLPYYMNIGLGHDYTINEYYQTVAEVMNFQGTFIHDLTKPVGMARKLVNVNRQISWGWTAKHDLTAGINKTYEFYLKEYM
ncbi:GDP-L-fucose synthase [Polynucleobacter sp. 30F-ANTBAC]|uniref:GDP-L-fucose synthase family protein n=1 Tax=Polynucleobacter sp. 30F-ANTBAC TaxID=2689095 RepID=UPI001C0B117E|nr:GDP-L-fucose synthase [Polynucleobacter sp. 30F-ANTBAC]MBU3599663.1 GDP-L-fucose synthase [Polynucleobacter sp. 30F-ANTBAC]